MTRSLRVTFLLPVLAVMAIGAGGCGDDGDDVEVTIPTISIEDETVPTETVAPETTETTAPETGGTGAPTADPNQEDSETNDKPPAPGSPEEAFEQACEQNPAACG